MLYVDSREPKNMIRKFKTAAAYNRLLKIEVTPLDSGDYVFGDVGIERKVSPADVMSSCFDRRLWRQVDVLEHTYTRAFLLLEGRMDYDDAMFKGIMTTLALFHNVRLLFTRDSDETVELVKAMYIKYGTERTEREPPAAVIRETTPEGIRSAMLQCVMGIGPVTAHRILEATPFIFGGSYPNIGYNLKHVKGLRPESLAMLLKVVGQ